VTIIDELKRRNVLRVATAYIVVAWLLIQVAETLFPLFGYGPAPARVVVIVVTIGLVPALILSWIFELTPQGLQRDDGKPKQVGERHVKKLDQVIIVTLVLALAYFAVDKFVFDPARDAALVEATTDRARSDALVESYGDNSIAVLPFVNMSPDEDQAYFADGLSEELLNLLARIPELRVISRTSSFGFRDENTSIPQVAEKLNVSHVLEGSVRKAGDEIRITVQLIDARSDTHLWSQTYDRSLDDIFAIQDDVAAKVVNQLRVTMLGQAPAAAPVDLRAYANLLKARQLNNSASADANERSEALLKEALAIDPGYVDALVELANVYRHMQRGSWPERQTEYDDLVSEYRAKALALDPDNVDVIAATAWDALRKEQNLAKAAELYESASAIDPENLSVIRGSGTLASELGEPELAIRLLEYVVNRDPMSLRHHYELAQAYSDAGRYDDALRQYSLAASLGDRQGVLAWAIGAVKLQAGDAAGALESFENALDETLGLFGVTLALHDLGLIEESEASLLRLKAMGEQQQAAYGEAFSDQMKARFSAALGGAHAWSGKNDGAFRYLRITADLDLAYFANVNTNWMLQKLHDDPRWLPFLRSIDRAPEQLPVVEFRPTLPYSLQR
jgi:adenylate cyclase